MTTKTIEKTATGTVRVQRVFKAPPERIYKALVDPAAASKWFPPHGFTCTVHQMDSTVGGPYRMTFTNFSTGKDQSFEGMFVELRPGERVRMTDRFDDPNLPGEIQTTYALRKVSVGTEVTVVQENIPAGIPADGCHLAWQECLDQLAKLVEPEIPDQP